MTLNVHQLKSIKKGLDQFGVPLTDDFISQLMAGHEDIVEDYAQPPKWGYGLDTTERDDIMDLLAVKMGYSHWPRYLDQHAEEFKDFRTDLQRLLEDVNHG